MSALRKVGKVSAIVVGVLVLVLLAYAGYAIASANGRLSFPDTPYPKIAASTDPAVIERGRYLAQGPAHCSSCHGAVSAKGEPTLTAGGEVPLSGGYAFDLGPLASFHAANLTPDAESGIGKRTDAELARAVRTGILHDGKFSMWMRFAAATPSDEDLSAILSYLRSQPPVSHSVPAPEWKLIGKMMLPMFPISVRPMESPKSVAAGKEPTLERGEYLAEHVALCTGCHTTYDMSTYEPTGPKAGGGSLDVSHGEDSDMEYQPPNLTSDASGITGQWDEETFLNRLHGGRLHKSSIMPWENFARMTDADVRSIYRYIKSLPAVHNELGPSYRKKGWKLGEP